MEETMKATINISIPIDLVRRDIFAQLQELDQPKYTFVKMTSRQEGQFEVEDDGTHGDLVKYTKKIIHAYKYGGVVMFQVVYNGQFFNGGPILDKLKK